MTVGGGLPGMAGRSRSLMPGTDQTFGKYLKFLNAVLRLLRKGKKRVAGDARTISTRLGVSPLGVAGTLKAASTRGCCGTGGNGLPPDDSAIGAYRAPATCRNREVAGIADEG